MTLRRAPLLFVLLLCACDGTTSPGVDASSGVDASTGADASTGVDAGSEDASTSLDAGGGTPDAGPPAGSMIIANVAATDIALAGGHVYFITDTMIGRVPVGGGAVETVHTFSTTAPNKIDADAARIVWTERNASAVYGAVNSCPLSGCGAAPTALPHGSETAGPISVEGDYAYWLSGSTRRVLGDGPGAWSVMSPGLSVADVAVETAEVFWLDGGVFTTPGAVYRCAATGGSCTPALVSDAVGAPSVLSVRGEHLVVLSDTGVFHMGRDGAGLTRLADGRRAGATDIVTDGTRVYWAILGELYGCDLASCTPALIEQTTGSNEWSSGLEIDTTHLYWGTRATIRRFEL